MTARSRHCHTIQFYIYYYTIPLTARSRRPAGPDGLPPSDLAKTRFQEPRLSGFCAPRPPRPSLFTPKNTTQSTTTLQKPKLVRDGQQPRCCIVSHNRASGLHAQHHHPTITHPKHQTQAQVKQPRGWIVSHTCPSGLLTREHHPKRTPHSRAPRPKHRNSGVAESSRADASSRTIWGARLVSGRSSRASGSRRSLHRRN